MAITFLKRKENILALRKFKNSQIICIKSNSSALRIFLNKKSLASSILYKINQVKKNAKLIEQ